MCQELINRNVDYLYRLQIEETEHQHHRLSWILAAQSIIFVGLCTLLPKCNTYVVHLIWLLAAIGVSLSISGIYSVLVGQLSIGTVLERWDEYDGKKKREKCKEIPHQVILSPSSVMRSRLQFLLLYSFAPKVFCAAWIALLAFVLTDKYINTPLAHPNIIIICYYLGALIAICIAAVYAGKFLLYQWFYKDTREKRSKKDCDEKSVTFDADCVPNCGDSLITNGNAFNKCQINLLNGCCRTGSIRRYDDYPEPDKCKGRLCAGNLYIPKGSDLRIYHIVVDRFNGGWTETPKNTNAFLGGKLRGITEKLDYIASQGYNAILLTPIFKSAAYHGYHTIDYTQIDPHFGTWQDFQELVDKAHAGNIKIMCDFVPNHCHISNRWFAEAQSNPDSPYRNWFYFDQSRQGGFVSYQNYPDMPKFNLFDNAAADCLIHAAMHLAKKGIDGLRIDHAIGVPFRFLKRLTSALKGINPEILVFGEICPYNLKDISQVEFRSCARKEDVINEDPNLQDNIQLDYVGVLDGVLDFEYRNIILDEIKLGHRIFGNSALKRRLKTHFSKYPPNFCLLLFLDNHDTNRILFSCNGDRMLMDEAVEFTKSLPYPSIIYYGTERYMTNGSDINDGTPYADLGVRGPMDWS